MLPCVACGQTRRRRKYPLGFRPGLREVVTDSQLHLRMPLEATANAATTATLPGDLLCFICRNFGRRCE